MEYNFPSEYNDFDIDLDLIIFSLLPHDKKKIDNLFYDNRKELTPLIYINTNLFENYTLFDTNVMQKIKYSSIMNQIIGNINIYSNNQDLDFNSDRTQFVQNKLTTDITKFIEKINIFIQEKASENKKYLIDFNIIKDDKKIIYLDNFDKRNLEFSKTYIKDDFPFKERLNIKFENSLLIYELFGKKANLKIETKKGVPSKKSNNPNITGNGENKIKEEPKPQESKINLQKKSIQRNINSGQINLRTYIKSAIDSLGNKIDTNLINIKCTIKSCNNGILPSQSNPYTEKVVYSYDDPITGNVSESLTIDFVDDCTPGFEFAKSKNIIIPNPIKNGYILDEDTSFKELVKQINSLNPKEYSCLIACSIRSIFELGAYDLYSTGKYQEIKFDSSLPETIYRIIDFAQNNKKLLNYIDNNTKLGYKNLKNNIFLPNQYKSAIFQSHIGAHKSTKFLSLADLESLGAKVSYFIILINEMLKFK